MKKLVLLGLCSFFLIAGVVSMGMAPFVATYAGIAPFSDTHNVTANYSITNLPRRAVLVGTPVGRPMQRNTTGIGPAEITANFIIVQISGASVDTIVATSSDTWLPLNSTNTFLGWESVNGVMTSTWSNPGLFEYRFFNEEPAPTRNESGTIINNNFTDPSRDNFIEPFHRHVVTVSQNQFSFAMPQNSAESLAVAAMGSDDATNPLYFLNNVHMVGVPNVTIPHLPIVLPLPSSFYDRNGNDLFLTRLNSQNQIEFPNLDLFKRLYPDLVATSAFQNMTTAQQHERLKQEVFFDTRIRFHGNGPVANVLNEIGPRLAGPVLAAGNGLPQRRETSPLTRTFIPRNAVTHWAEFLFQHEDGVTVASFRTNNIAVDDARVGENVGQVLGHPGTTPIDNQVRFEFNPTIGSAPTTLQLNRPADLPRPTVHLSRAEDGNARNPVELSAETVNNFTFARVEFMPENSNTWEIARGPNNELYDFVTDFTFIPTRIGGYRITYFTTTIFRAGFDHSEPFPGHIVTNISGNIPVAGYTGTTFMRYSPHTLDKLFVSIDAVHPQVRWTREFEYIGNHAYELDENGDRVLDDDGNPVRIDFEHADDMSRYLPGRGLNARTQISSTAVTGGTGRESILSLPALLGFSPTTTSREMTYTIRIRREIPGQQNRDSVTFSTTNNNANPIATTGSSLPFDNSSRLEIDFSGNNFGDAPLPNNAVAWRNGNRRGDLNSLFSSPGGSVNARYDIMVYARSLPQGNQVLGLPTLNELIYSFEVTSNYTMNQEPPTFQDGIRMQQTAYYEEDVISFRPVNVSDDFTDDANIEVEYFLNFNRRIGTTNTFENVFIPITEELNTTGGSLTLPLNPRDNDIAYDLIRSIPMDAGVLPVTLIAVARNFYAMKQGNYYLDNTGVPNNPLGGGIAVEQINFRIYSLAYGEAAIISFGNGVQSWQQAIEAANTGNNPSLARYNQVNLPAFNFAYPSVDANLVSTIIIEVIQPISNTRIAIGEGWTIRVPSETAGGVTIGGGTNPNLNTPLSFEPNEIGPHTVVARITNAGGNITVFTAEIIIVGTPTYQVGIVGGVESTSVGRTVGLPSVVLTINGRQFRTSQTGLGIVSDFEFSNGGTVIPAGFEVGQYFISWTRPGSNQSLPAPSNNNFTPTEAGRFTFTFHLEIENDKLRDLGIYVSTTEQFLRPRQVTHTIVVSGLSRDDISIELDARSYSNLYLNVPSFDATGNVIANSIMAWDHEGNPFQPNPNHIPGIMPWNAFSNFTSSYTVGGTNQFTIDNETLRANLIPIPQAGGETIFEYAPIFLPRFHPVLADGVTLSADVFPRNVESRLTVRGPNAAADEYLLDTDADNVTQFVTLANGQQFFYFQPQGRIDGNHNPVGNANLRVDGEYIVTYTITFDIITIELQFSIMMGDTARPTIEFEDSTMQEELFGPIRRVDFVFNFDTRWLRVNNMGGETNFDDHTVATRLTGLTNEGHFIVRRPDGTVMSHVHNGNVADGVVAVRHNQAQIDEHHYQHFSFRLQQTGTYRIELRIESDARQPANRFFNIVVEAQAPEPRISPTEIWGIVLIVVSSGLLLAVVIYFIKTGRDTRFAGNTRRIRKVKGEDGEIEGDSVPERPAKRSLKMEKPEKPDQV